MTLTINQRLMAIIFGAIAALGLIGLIGYFSARTMTDDLQYTDENIIRSIATLSSAERDFLLIRVNALYHLSYSDKAKKRPHEETIQKNIQEVKKRLEEYEKDLVVNEVDRNLLNTDKQLFSNYLIALDKVLENSRANDRESAVIVIENEWKPAGEKLTAAFAEHTRYKERLADEIVRKSLYTGQRNSMLTLVATLAAVIFVILVGWLVKRGISN